MASGVRSPYRARNSAARSKNLRRQRHTFRINWSEEAVVLFEQRRVAVADRVDSTFQANPVGDADSHIISLEPLSGLVPVDVRTLESVHQHAGVELDPHGLSPSRCGMTRCSRRCLPWTSWVAAACVALTGTLFATRGLSNAVARNVLMRELERDPRPTPEVRLAVAGVVAAHAPNARSRHAPATALGSLHRGEPRRSPTHTRLRAVLPRRTRERSRAFSKAAQAVPQRLARWPRAVPPLQPAD